MDTIAKFDSQILTNKGLIKNKVEYRRKIVKQTKPMAQLNFGRA